MRETYSINESCGCGARFIYEETINESYHSNMNTEHRRFLDAHKDCRNRIIIADNKQLKMFLVDKKGNEDDN